MLSSGRRAVTALLVLSAVTGPSLGCLATDARAFGEGGAERRSPPVAIDRTDGPPRQAPDVVLIVVDTLRADVLGCDGSGRGLTPSIDALAARGTRYERALATSSWTVPSVASLLTGLHPEGHGVEEGTVRDRRAVLQSALDESTVTLAERFRDAGYHTVGITTNVYLSEPLGFAQGFDVFETIPWGRASQVVEWLESHRTEIDAGRPRFVWVHLFDPHHPYRPQEPPFLDLLPPDWAPGPGGERPGELAWRFAGLRTRDLETREDLGRGGHGLPVLRAAYESEVALTDAAVGRILPLLDADDDTIVLLTADHGEEFREHGRLGHRQSLYSELVRVPLVVSWPARLPPGRSVAEPVSLVDVCPTLLDLAGLPAAAGELPGRTLREGGELGHGGDRPVHTTVLFEGRRLRSVARGPLRLVLDVRSGRTELFDESVDRGDEWNLSATRRAEAMELLREIEPRGASLGAPERAPTRQLDPETADQLRSLGYLSD